MWTRHRPSVRLPKGEGAGPRARPLWNASFSRWLPGAAAGAAALGAGAAGARGGAARHLLDRERVARLRVGHDRVVVRLGGRDRDRGLRQVETRVLALDV